jgi:hypothetical protein
VRGMEETHPTREIMISCMDKKPLRMSKGGRDGVKALVGELMRGGLRVYISSRGPKESLMRAVKDLGVPMKNLAANSGNIRQRLEDASFHQPFPHPSL